LHGQSLDRVGGANSVEAVDQADAGQLVRYCAGKADKDGFRRRGWSGRQR
jgi:hypothetical protein